MRNKKLGKAPKPLPAARSAPQWPLIVAGIAAVTAALAAYAPALNGPFVFDDQYLPFFSPRFGEQPLWAVIRGVRPFLMFNFWLDNKLVGAEPFWYHLVNLLLHVFNALLVFLVARRVFSRSGAAAVRARWLAVFAGALFLLHPLATESVSYVASRSECLSVFFFYAALAVFLFRRSEAISWKEAGAVLLLYAAAASTKEHTVALPAVLLLTDWFFSERPFTLEGIRRNWRLYALLAVMAPLAVAGVFYLTRGSLSAGFGLKDLPWRDYFYTQWRVLWVYLRMVVLPFGQNVDHAYPVVRSPLDPGALAGLLGLALLAGGAIWFRRRFPAACYGVLAALILFAPTSSILPIQDVLVERRLYLPMGMLVLVLADVLNRVPVRPRVVAAAACLMIAAFGLLTWRRNHVWADSAALWEDSVRKAPHNGRAHFQLGVAYYQSGRCDAAAREFEAASKLRPPDFRLYVDWALAEDCLNHLDRAMELLREAAFLHPDAHTYSLMAMIYAKQGKLAEGMEAVNTALSLDPRHDIAYFYRGNLYTALGDWRRAAGDYRQALALDPSNDAARRGLARAQAHLNAR